MLNLNLNQPFKVLVTLSKMQLASWAISMSISQRSSFPVSSTWLLKHRCRAVCRSTLEQNARSLGKRPSSSAEVFPSLQAFPRDTDPHHASECILGPRVPQQLSYAKVPMWVRSECPILFCHFCEGGGDLQQGKIALYITMPLRQGSSRQSPMCL